MKTVAIIHGIGGHAGIHWQQWLGDQLTALGYQVLMPDLPNSDRPDRKIWLQEVTKMLQGVDLSQLILVGHSLGVTTALDFIEQADGPIRGLLSVSGFAEDYGAELNSYFLKEKSINFETIKNKLSWAAVLYGDNDPYVSQIALQSVASSLGVTPIVVPKGGHLNTDAGFAEFPQLLAVLEQSDNEPPTA